jgi:hypothetical protein
MIVVEIVCDPYREGRTMQALEAERVPILEFLPHAAGPLHSA